MVLSPAATWLVYMVGIGLLFTCVAAIADLWLAKAERDARRQARTLVRAQRREEQDSSRLASRYSLPPLSERWVSQVSGHERIVRDTRSSNVLPRLPTSVQTRLPTAGQHGAESSGIDDGIQNGETYAA